MNTKFSFRDLITSLREGGHTSIGCYPKFYYTADGEALSHEAVKENLLLIGRAMKSGYDQQWEVVGVDCNWEDPNMYCSHTYKRIESAYEEPEIIAS